MSILSKKYAAFFKIYLVIWINNLFSHNLFTHPLLVKALTFELSNVIDAHQSVTAYHIREKQVVLLKHSLVLLALFFANTKIKKKNVLNQI